MVDIPNAYLLKLAEQLPTMQSFKWGEQALLVLENSSITLVETPMDLEKPLIQFPKGASSQTPFTCFTWVA